MADKHEGALLRKGAGLFSKVERGAKGPPGSPDTAAASGPALRKPKPAPCSEVNRAMARPNAVFKVAEAPNPYATGSGLVGQASRAGMQISYGQGAPQAQQGQYRSTQAPGDPNAASGMGGYSGAPVQAGLPGRMPSVNFDAMGLGSGGDSQSRMRMLMQVAGPLLSAIPGLIQQWQSGQKGQQPAQQGQAPAAQPAAAATPKPAAPAAKPAALSNPFGADMVDAGGPAQPKWKAPTNPTANVNPLANKPTSVKQQNNQSVVPRPPAMPPKPAATTPAPAAAPAVKAPAPAAPAGNTTGGAKGAKGGKCGPECKKASLLRKAAAGLYGIEPPPMARGQQRPSPYAGYDPITTPVTNPICDPPDKPMGTGRPPMASGGPSAYTGVQPGMFTPPPKPTRPAAAPKPAMPAAAPKPTAAPAMGGWQMKASSLLKAAAGLLDDLSILPNKPKPQANNFKVPTMQMNAKPPMPSQPAQPAQMPGMGGSMASLPHSQEALNYTNRLNQIRNPGTSHVPTYGIQGPPQTIKQPGMLQRAGEELTGAGREYAAQAGHDLSAAGQGMTNAVNDYAVKPVVNAGREYAAQAGHDIDAAHQGLQQAGQGLMGAGREYAAQAGHDINAVGQGVNDYAVQPVKNLAHGVADYGREYGKQFSQNYQGTGEGLNNAYEGAKGGISNAYNAMRTGIFGGETQNPEYAQHQKMLQGMTRQQADEQYPGMAKDIPITQGGGWSLGGTKHDPFMAPDEVGEYNAHRNAGPGAPDPTQTPGWQGAGADANPRIADYNPGEQVPQYNPAKPMPGQRSGQFAMPSNGQGAPGSSMGQAPTYQSPQVPENFGPGGPMGAQLGGGSAGDQPGWGPNGVAQVGPIQHGQTMYDKDMGPQVPEAGADELAAAHKNPSSVLGRPLSADAVSPGGKGLAGAADQAAAYRNVFPHSNWGNPGQSGAASGGPDLNPQAPGGTPPVNTLSDKGMVPDTKQLMSSGQGLMGGYQTYGQMQNASRPKLPGSIESHVGGQEGPQLRGVENPGSQNPPYAQPQQPDSRFWKQHQQFKDEGLGSTGNKVRGYGGKTDHTIQRGPGANENYYKRLESEGNRLLSKIQAKQDNGEELSPTEANYMQRRQNFASGQDVNEFNNDRSRAGNLAQRQFNQGHLQAAQRARPQYEQAYAAAQQDWAPKAPAPDYDPRRGMQAGQLGLTHGISGDGMAGGYGPGRHTPG